jgi:hypothetical protein
MITLTKNEDNIIYPLTKTSDYGFILTRHVNSEKTNLYWNYNVKMLKKLYPFKTIVIIDDNSDRRYLKKMHTIEDNIIVIQSEYPRRGELLPYIYFAKYKWFDKAVIIHDSTFFNIRFPFEEINKPVIPIWDFADGGKQLHLSNSLRIANYLKYSKLIKSHLRNSLSSRWVGCFGVQSYITHSFLLHIIHKYDLRNLLHAVNTRDDRCSLERIMGVIFYLEANVQKSILGCCYKIPFGLKFDQYIKLKKQNKLYKPISKVFTGR